MSNRCSIKLDGRKQINFFKNLKGERIAANKTHNKYYSMFFEGVEIASYLTKEESEAMLNIMGAERFTNTI